MNAIIIILLAIVGQNAIWCYEPFSLGVITQFLGMKSAGMASLAAIGGSALYQSFTGLKCNFIECCPKEWHEPNLEKLNQVLKKSLHGQQLVRNLLLRALKSHYMTDNPDKALVLSFHGWTGSGKNFVAKHIVNSIYKDGMKSKFVHLFISQVHFPHEDKVDIYKIHIQDWIRGNVSQCEQSIFIFDEIDKMPIGVINSIKPFIDHHEEIDGVNFRKAIFIFLSNTGSYYINEKVVEIWSSGTEISSIKYSDLEPLVQKGAFNEIGGLHNSDVIRHNLVDYYVPFLPMQKNHVLLCIRDELHRRGVQPTEKLVQSIADSLSYFPPATNLLSTTGCKKVSQKTAFYLAEETVYHDFL